MFLAAEKRDYSPTSCGSDSRMSEGRAESNEPPVVCNNIYCVKVIKRFLFELDLSFILTVHPDINPTEQQSD